MCGIVGYVGKDNAKDILLNGLATLEYRGYDSSGVALFEKDGIEIIRQKAACPALVKKLRQAEKNLPRDAE